MGNGRGVRIILDRSVFCDFNCGNYAKYMFKNGTKCCSDYASRCPNLRLKVGKKSKGHKHTEETKKLLAEKAKKQWSNEVTRNRILTAILSEERKNKISKFQKQLCNDVRECKRRSVRTSKSWKNEQIRNKRIAGLIKASNNPDRIKKISDFQKELCRNPMEINRRSKRMTKVWNNPVERKKRIDKMRSPEVRTKLSKSVAEAYIRGDYDIVEWNQGWFYSNKNKRNLHYRSSYELAAYSILEQLSKVKFYEVEPFKIPYFIKKVKHYTIPDILVTYIDNSKELIEVKPENFLDKQKNPYKFKAMNRYALKNNMKFSIWTEKQLGV